MSLVDMPGASKEIMLSAGITFSEARVPYVRCSADNPSAGDSMLTLGCLTGDGKSTSGRNLCLDASL